MQRAISSSHLHHTLPFDNIYISVLLSQKHFHVKSFNQHLDLSDKVLSKELNGQLASAVYLQVSTISQALIFVTRSRSWSYKERPGLLLLSAFIIAQLVNASKLASY